MVSLFYLAVPETAYPLCLLVKLLSSCLSDITIFVLKRDVKLQLTNSQAAEQIQVVLLSPKFVKNK